MFAQLRPALVLLLLMTVLTGIIYPLAITGLAGWWWSEAAHGSLVQRNSVVVGSSLIGQAFTGPAYFHPRPSAAGSGYDASASSGSNLGPTSQVLVDAVRERVDAARSDGGSVKVPADLVTTSGSGLDPHLSPAAVEWQLARVARARQIPESDLQALVAMHTEGRTLMLFGEPRVNVLQLNLALDQQFPLNR
jgi:K+-transporting ATPase ATPase C chain